jgi:hypothetical protein
MPQPWLVGPSQTCPVQARPQRQLPPQLRSPLDPHAVVEFGVHSPSPKQALQSEYSPVVMSQVRVCVPHRPHARRAAPSQVCPVHATSQRQLPPQVCSPLRPQAMVESGLHSPSSSHTPQSAHTAVLASQLRVREPQLPQGPLATPSHACWVHSLHSQLPSQA